MMVSIVNSEKLPDIVVFPAIEDMSAALINFMVGEFNNSLSENKSYHISLSGGNTPIKIFDYFSQKDILKTNLNFLHIYWGDERCVPSDDQDSNYGNMWNTILKNINIPPENIHRIHGEIDPDIECKRYSDVLKNFIPSFRGFPRFDLTLLGIGEDGHTASIFPDSKGLFDTNENCYVAIHPQSKQKRITASLKVLNNSRNIVFLASGASKAEILATVLQKEPGFENLPVSHIKPENGVLKWYLDREAAGKLLI